MKEKIRVLWALFATFFKIGAFTFGGGYAMIPLIQRETVENKKWITESQIVDIIAIAESTPGPIAINSATFVGYKTAGVLGAISATLGVIVPSFAIILVISGVLTQFKDNQTVQYAFNGIRAGVVALVFKALWSMYKQLEKRPISYIISGAAFCAVAFLGVSAIITLAICAVIGFTVERSMKK